MTYITHEIAQCEEALRQVGSRVPEAVIKSMIPLKYHGKDKMTIRTDDGRIAFISGIDRQYAGEIVELFASEKLRFPSESKLGTFAA